MPNTTNIYIPLQFNQLVDLIKALPKKEKQQLKGDGYSKRAAIKHFKSKKVSQMLSYFSPKLFNFTTIFIIFQNLQKQLSLIFRFLHFEIKNYMDGGE